MQWVTWLIFLSYPLWETFLHAALARFVFSDDTPHQKQAFLAILLGFGFLVGGALWSEGSSLTRSSLLLILVWGVCLSHVYFHAYNMSETARRIRMLLNLRENLPVAPMISQNSDAVVGRRLERLLALNQMTVEQGRYVGRKTFLMYVAVFLRSYEKFIFPGRV